MDITAVFTLVKTLQNHARVLSTTFFRFLNTLIQKDIHELVQIDHPEQMSKLLRLTAFYAGKLVNLSELGAKLNMNHVSLKKYMALLEQLFLANKPIG